MGQEKRQTEVGKTKDKMQQSILKDIWQIIIKSYKNGLLADEKSNIWRHNGSYFSKTWKASNHRVKKSDKLQKEKIEENHTMV